MVILTLLVSLIQIWWVIAYFIAYIRIKDGLLLLQIVQGVSFGLLFIFLSIAILTQQQMGGIFSGILLLIGLVMGFIWRRRNGINMLIDHYPRAIIDVLLFQQPLDMTQQRGKHRKQKNSEENHNT
jgi:hypothetical protein